MGDGINKDRDFKLKIDEFLNNFFVEFYFQTKTKLFTFTKKIKTVKTVRVILRLPKWIKLMNITKWLTTYQRTHLHLSWLAAKNYSIESFSSYTKRVLKFKVFFLNTSNVIYGRSLFKNTFGLTYIVYVCDSKSAN